MGRTVLARTSAAIGVLFGALSVIAGGRVLAGVDRPDYVVLSWLVIYNVAAGAVGVGAGVGLWVLRRWAIRLSWFLAGAHATVLIVLVALWGTGRAVATDSLLAMLLRAAVWVSIALVTGRAQFPEQRSATTSRNVP